MANQVLELVISWFLNVEKYLLTKVSWPSWALRAILILSYIVAILGIVDLTVGNNSDNGDKSSPADSNNKKKVSTQFRNFQFQYLLVYILIMLADWLQGTNMYTLYSSYGVDVGALFLTGFLSSAVFGTFLGIYVDKWGRRLGCVIFCVLEIIINGLEHINSMPLLMFGRVLGGLSTSLLFSAFESWMVTEHRKRNFDEDLLSSTFSISSWGNGVVAIAAGILAKYSYDMIEQVSPGTGHIGPFQLAIALTVLSLVFIWYWPENYGQGDGGDDEQKNTQQQQQGGGEGILKDDTKNEQTSTTTTTASASVTATTTSNSGTEKTSKESHAVEMWLTRVVGLSPSTDKKILKRFRQQHIHSFNELELLAMYELEKKPSLDYLTNTFDMTIGQALTFLDHLKKLSSYQEGQKIQKQCSVWAQEEWDLQQSQPRQQGKSAKNVPGNDADGEKDDEVVWSIFSSFTHSLGEILKSPTMMCLGLSQAFFEGAMYTFVFMWVPALMQVNKEVVSNVGLVFSCLMLAMTIGGILFGLVLPYFPGGAEGLTVFVYIVAAMSMAVPIITFEFWPMFIAFLVFEAMVGMFNSCGGMLRSKYYPGHLQSSIMSVFRVPLNLLVVLGTNLTNKANDKESLGFVFGVTVGMHLIAVVLQLMLQAFSSRNKPKSD